MSFASVGLVPLWEATGHSDSHVYLRSHDADEDATYSSRMSSDHNQMVDTSESHDEAVARSSFKIVNMHIL